MTRIAIIGSGFSGFSVACLLAKEGYNVTISEKNAPAGGRESKFEASGFTFDRSPGWYWMPNVFENFLAHVAPLDIVMKPRIRITNPDKARLLAHSYVKHQLNML